VIFDAGDVTPAADIDVSPGIGGGLGEAALRHGSQDAGDPKEAGDVGAKKLQS
jgi:hypothetical protein